MVSSRQPTLLVQVHILPINRVVGRLGPVLRVFCDVYLNFVDLSQSLIKNRYIRGLSFLTPERGVGRFFQNPKKNSDPPQKGQTKFRTPPKSLKKISDPPQKRQNQFRTPPKFFHSINRVSVLGLGWDFPEN